MRRVMVWLCRMREKQPIYLLLEKTKPKVLPGGMNWRQPVTAHCGEDEPERVTAVREVGEETGVVTTQDSLIHLASITLGNGDSMACYGCMVKGEPSIVLSKEHSRYRWLTYEDTEETLKAEGSLREYQETLKLFHEKLADADYFAI